MSGESQIELMKKYELAVDFCIGSVETCWGEVFYWGEGEDECGSFDLALQAAVNEHIKQRGSR